jgi:hypothetical protein
MKTLVMMMLTLLVTACTTARVSVESQPAGAAPGSSVALPAGPSSDALNKTAEKAEHYVKAYPDFFASFTDGCIVTRGGAGIVFDDGAAKDLDALIEDKGAGDDSFDPEDALHWDYPAGGPLPTASSPPTGDPGRIRPRSVFAYMYGSTPAERAKHIRTISWPGTVNGKPRKVAVTTVNGVDRALGKVAAAIDALPDGKKRELEGIVFGVDGPYGHYDRPVRGFPGRLSGHAYGIAVDINGNLDYFSDTHRNEPYCYRNNVPAFLVEIFERNGFIWGGRWHSYDAMHFEYRPELLDR